MKDLIERQAAIDALGKDVMGGLNYKRILNSLPSAQPDEKRTEERTETHACDLISRQAAIGAISSMFAPAPTQKDMVEDCLEIIENLPSAQPQRMKGRWYHGDAYPHHLYCSVCYRTALPNDEYVERWNLHMNYCPNCGADMRGEQDG